MLGRSLGRKADPGKQAEQAHTTAIERGSKLGINEWQLRREQLQLGAKLGAGGFGTVFKCKLDGQEAVAKQIAQARLGAKDLPLLQNEVRLWAKLDHPNCIKFFGIIIDTSYYYLLCELMPGGSLAEKHQRLRSQSKQGPIPIPQTPQLLADMGQVAGAMAHLHVKKILHRDLKSANVLYGGDGRLCVADFGLVRYHQSDAPADMTAETGSYRWMAPEVIRHEPYGTGCDVYSFAILCWEMVTYSIPFPRRSPIEVALAVANEGLRPQMPSHAPHIVAQMIESCWQQDPQLRPSFEQICSRVDALEGGAPLSAASGGDGGGGSSSSQGTTAAGQPQAEAPLTSEKC